LNKDDRFRIGADIKAVARVQFCIVDGRMVLLHGFIKKTRKTPRSDLDLALDRKRKLERPS